MFKSRSGSNSKEVKTPKRKRPQSVPFSTTPATPEPSAAPARQTPFLPKPINTFLRTYSAASADSTPITPVSPDKDGICQKLLERCPSRDDEGEMKDLFSLAQNSFTEASTFEDFQDAENDFASELNYIVEGRSTESPTGSKNPDKGSLNLDEIELSVLTELTEEQAREALSQDRKDDDPSDERGGRSNPLLFASATPAADRGASTPEP